MVNGNNFGRIMKQLSFKDLEERRINQAIWSVGRRIFMSGESLCLEELEENVLDLLDMENDEYMHSLDDIKFMIKKDYEEYLQVGEQHYFPYVSSDFEGW